MCRLATSRRAGVAGLVLAAAVSATPTWAAFTVNGRHIERDGIPFQVRGVCYQPAPIGQDPSASPPYGDYFTAGYADLTARDLPNIRALGANVVRIYGWDPAADHTAFLDACYNGGESPVYVIVNRWIDPSTDWSNGTAVEAIRQSFLQIDAGLGAHPAVLALVLGNEVNVRNGNGDNPAFWSAMNSVAASIKQQTPLRLVSVAITDALPQVAAYDASMSALDFWSVQAYRGTTLGSFFGEYAAGSARPLVLTEFGIDAYNNVTGQPYPDNAAFVASVVGGLWTEIAGNASVCSGGCVFEYCDEWWKAGSADTHDTGGYALASFPDGFGNEEWWGLYVVSKQAGEPDRLAPRATVEALRTAWAPPTIAITAAPISQTVAPGGSAVLAVEVDVSGGVAPGFQWLKDGIEIPGATDAALVFDALTATDSGWYAVRIVAGDTVSVSERARLLVAVPEIGHMVNMSLRSRVGTGEDVLIAGFVVDGNVPRRMLVRGVGPGLQPLGVNDPLADPVLELFDDKGRVIASNDDWGDTQDVPALLAASRAVWAFELSSGSKDAALLRTLPAGLFTAHVRGAEGSTGVALVEVYDVP